MPISEQTAFCKESLNEGVEAGSGMDGGDGTDDDDREENKIRDRLSPRGKRRKGEGERDNGRDSNKPRVWWDPGLYIFGSPTPIYVFLLQIRVTGL